MQPGRSHIRTHANDGGTDGPDSFFVFFLAIETSATSCSSCWPFVLSTHTHTNTYRFTYIIWTSAHTHTCAKCAKQKILSDDFIVSFWYRYFSSKNHPHSAVNESKLKTVYAKIWISRITAGVSIKAEHARARNRSRSKTHIHARYCVWCSRVAAAAATRGSFIVFLACSHLQRAYYVVNRYGRVARRQKSKLKSCKNV